MFPCCIIFFLKFKAQRISICKNSPGGKKLGGLDIKCHVKLILEHVKMNWFQQKYFFWSSVLLECLRACISSVIGGYWNQIMLWETANVNQHELVLPQIGISLHRLLTYTVLCSKQKEYPACFVVVARRPSSPLKRVCRTLNSIANRYSHLLLLCVIILLRILVHTWHYLLDNKWDFGRLIS